MKIIALIRTANSTLLVTATRAPDLLRRELSLQFGVAHLLWCSVPPKGKNSTEVAQRLHLAALNGGLRGFQVARLNAFLIEPILEKLKVRLGRVLRKLRCL